MSGLVESGGVGVWVITETVGAIVALGRDRMNDDDGIGVVLFG